MVQAVQSMFVVAVNVNVPFHWAIQAGLLTPLTFAQLLGCFYCRCVLSSQWKVVTVN